VFRNYFVHEQLPSAAAADEGKRPVNQLNTLSQLERLVGNHTGEKAEEGKFWSISNGYSFSTEEKLRALRELVEIWSQDEWTRARDAVCIGVQRDVEVVFRDRNWEDGFVLLKQSLAAGDEHKQREGEDKQVVTQAFCSAVSCSYSGLSASLWEPLAILVLEGAYFATLYTGVLNLVQTGNRRVLLTRLGGGVFGNRDEWIAAAIAAALVDLHKVFALHTFSSKN
jgi:hypothetical protein